MRARQAEESEIALICEEWAIYEEPEQKRPPRVDGTVALRYNGRHSATFWRRQKLDRAHGRQVLDDRAIDRALTRMAAEIVERAQGATELAIVGIRTRGVPLAGRLAAAIERIEGHAPVQGALDITLYRDDVAEAPRALVRSTDLPFDVTGRTIVLVDDVLYTGRTVRAALDALMDHGRPKAVRLAVLCDRGGRELPVRADYVGVTVDAKDDEKVIVQLVATDGLDRVLVRSRS